MKNIIYVLIVFISLEVLGQGAKSSDEISFPEPYLKLNFNGDDYGFSNTNILRYDKLKKQWFRFMKVDISIRSAALFDNRMLIADADLIKQYSVDVKQKAISEYDLPKHLFSDLIVKELRFENGSQGCFHLENSVKKYLRKGDSFIVDKGAKSEFLSNSSKEIDGDKLAKIIQVVDESRFEKVSLNDLNITSNDIEEFKDFIDKEEIRIKEHGIDDFDFDNFYSFPSENVNFSFYKSVADSLFTLSEDDINNVFWLGYGNWSTTTDWRRVVFVFQNGKELVIENSDDRPSYLYTPWVVDFEGLKFRVNSVRFGKHIEEITNGQFFSGVTSDNNYAIFKIADYMYWKRFYE